ARLKLEAVVNNEIGPSVAQAILCRAQTRRSFDCTVTMSTVEAIVEFGGFAEMRNGASAKSLGDGSVKAVRFCSGLLAHAQGRELPAVVVFYLAGRATPLRRGHQAPDALPGCHFSPWTADLRHRDPASAGANRNGYRSQRILE